MGKSSVDEKILSYNDVVLRKSDLDILSGPFFLNDRIIEFYFSYLSSCHPSDDILLVPPGIAFWIANCPDSDSLNDCIRPLKLPGKKLVIFPVNNNDDFTVAEGGSHWSLLVFERYSNIFVHHDSYGGCNKEHAKKLYKVIFQFMGITDPGSCEGYMDFHDSPQQLNSYDCGMYVIAIAKVICWWYESDEPKNADTLWFSSVKDYVTPSSVSKMRTEILELIRDLMSKQAGASSAR